MYVFINPKQQTQNEKKITWELAQKEIAEAKGYSSKNSSLTKGFTKFLGVLKILNHFLFPKDQKAIQEEIIELLPIVTDVNAISDELNKHRLFEIILVPAIAFEQSTKSSDDQKCALIN